jgi:hypothetical protein
VWFARIRRRGVRKIDLHRCARDRQQGRALLGDPVIMLLSYDEIPGPVPVPADRSVWLDEPVVAVDRLPSGRNRVLREQLGQRWGNTIFTCA